MKRYRAFGAHIQSASNVAGCATARRQSHFLAPCGENIDPNLTAMILIYGAGGHGQVIADTLLRCGQFVVFADDHANSAPGLFQLVDSKIALQEGVRFIVAIGDNATRQRIHETMVNRGAVPAKVVHPSAQISHDAEIGPGVFIGPNTVVNAGAKIDAGAIINSGAIVEHHCRIGPFAHIAPGAALGGLVTVGARTLVGINAAVRPRITLGDDCTIGVGAAVVTDIPSNKTAVGVPARVR